MAGYKCVSIEITRGYGSSEFHDDLKSVLMTAGAENVPTVFLFSDSQIVEESFLEDLNNVLGSGEVRLKMCPRRTAELRILLTDLSMPGCASSVDHRFLCRGEATGSLHGGSSPSAYSQRFPDPANVQQLTSASWLYSLWVIPPDVAV